MQVHLSTHRQISDVMAANRAIVRDTKEKLSPYRTREIFFTGGKKYM